MQCIKGPSVASAFATRTRVLAAARISSEIGVRAGVCYGGNVRSPGTSRQLGSARICSSQFAWSTVNPSTLSADTPGVCENLVGGVWTSSAETRKIVDPLHGGDFITVPQTSADELEPFVRAAATCPKSGLHNPIRNPHRYVLYGDIAAKTAEELSNPEVAEYFAKLIQRVVPKHIEQCNGEVNTVRRWLQTFSGDGVRQLARSFGVPGDHYGQHTHGYRWPFGPVAVITPFNFPLEIPALQTMSALFMGNRPLLKVDEKVSVVIEQFVRLLIHCGMPKEDVDLLYSTGPVANELLLRTQPRVTMFTGSEHIAEKLCQDMHGKVKLEDAGFDWKILGPDVLSNLEYVAWQSDQDAYGFSGQKCSAQSMVFAHKNWVAAGFYDRICQLAAQRTVADLTISPVLTNTNEQIDAHTKKLLEIPGARVLFGGAPIEEKHTIPACYGSYKPTAVFVPLESMLRDEHFKAATMELFGPFQVITEYDDDSLDLVLEACERMDKHLTAAVVSEDTKFINHILGHTVNGTTYVGSRARTTGAPANHWFGPCGDPRSAGIHTIEAIQSTWSGHREVIVDNGIPADWTRPPPV
eukprot:m.8855 g.8855  ORF g.8855 m.8855 type:complete len:582 (-) comp6770_c0_seq1:965-2710(-)